MKLYQTLAFQTGFFPKNDRFKKIKSNNLKHLMEYLPANSMNVIDEERSTENEIIIHSSFAQSEAEKVNLKFDVIITPDLRHGFNIKIRDMVEPASSFQAEAEFILESYAESLMVEVK